MKDKRKLINDLIFEVTGVCVETAPDDATLESLGLDILDVWSVEERCIEHFGNFPDLSLETTLQEFAEKLENTDFTGAC